MEGILIRVLPPILGLWVLAACDMSHNSVSSVQTPSSLPSATQAAVPTHSASARFYSVQFISSKVGWAAGAAGIFSTQDGGAHWDLRHPEVPPLQGGEVDVIDDHAVYALGNEGLIVTTDAGDHWSPRSPDAENHPTRTTFVSVLKGFVVAPTTRGDVPQSLLRTDDGGNSYTELFSPADSLCFGGVNVGWVASGMEVKRTVDGGATWSTSFTSPVQNEGDKVWQATLACARDDVAWVLLSDGVGLSHQAYVVFRTVDGGAHWKTAISSDRR